MNKTTMELSGDREVVISRVFRAVPRMDQLDALVASF